MKRLLIMTTMALLAGDAVAANGWPSCFPGWEHWRDQVQMNATIYTAIVERCNALTGIVVDASVYAHPDAPAFYRDQVAALERYKTKTLQLLPYYAIPYYENRTDYLNYFNYGLYGEYDADLEIPVWNEISICITNRLPTNYFRFTPWSNLEGGGPFTNDSTVGHPYAWVTSNTLAGGAVFPAGRTNWYTSDYGWNGMTAILSRCVWSLGDNYPVTNSVTRMGYVDLESSSIVALDDRRLAASGYFATNIMSHTGPSASNWPHQYTYTFPKRFTTSYEAETISSESDVVAFRIMGTPQPYEMHWYFETTWYTWDLIEANTNTYDKVSWPAAIHQKGSWAPPDDYWYGWGTPLSVYGIQGVGAGSAANIADGYASVTAGWTNAAPWCPLPIFAGDERATSRGWKWKKNNGLLLKWDSATGFTWW